LSFSNKKKIEKILSRAKIANDTNPCLTQQDGIRAKILGELMATLNIKNLPDHLYRKIQARARREHRSISQEVIHILSMATENAAPLSILDLQGLGKDIWKKVNASKHVNRERREWD
jgi:plasmid stability protein